MHHAPASIMFCATLPTGHHPGFGKWCKVPLSSITTGSNHNTHISSTQEALAAVPAADNKHALDWGQHKFLYGRQATQCNAQATVPPPRLHNTTKGLPLTSQRQATQMQMRSTCMHDGHIATWQVIISAATILNRLIHACPKGQSGPW